METFSKLIRNHIVAHLRRVHGHEPEELIVEAWLHSYKEFEAEYAELADKLTPDQMQQILRSDIRDRLDQLRNGPRKPQ